MPQQPESFALEPTEPPRTKSDPEYYIPMQEADRLRAKADQLTAHTYTISQYNGELDDLVNVLAGGGNSSWQGRRANRFASDWHDVNGSVSNWVRQIENAADNLYSEAAALVRQAEDYLAGG